MAMFIGGSAMLSDDAGVIILVLSFLIALVLSIVFFPKSRRETMGSAGRGFHDLFNFRHFFIADILKFAYIFLTAAFIISGIYVLIDVGAEGFLYIIVGPIAIRLIFELVMMFIALVESTCEINNKLKNQNTSEQSQAPTTYAPAAPSYTPPVQEPVNYATFVRPVQPAEPTPVVEQVPHYAPAPEPAPQQSQVVYCTNCGAPCDSDARFCINCGATIQ